MKITTHQIYPPTIQDVAIFDYGYGYVAYYEGDEEGGPRGFGPTQDAAIIDLTENFPDDGAKVLP